MKKVLVIVAHPDDEVLGCGATLIKHRESGDEIRVIALTDGDSSRNRGLEQRRKAQFHKSCSELGASKFYHFDYVDQKLDSYPLKDIVKSIVSVKTQYTPDIIYTHTRSDLNLDHKIVNQATMTAFRPLPGEKECSILSFEIPSSTGWDSHSESFNPNYFIPCDEKHIDKKIEIMAYYSEEVKDFPHPRSSHYIKSLAQVRGANIGFFFAEAFFVERVILKA